MENTEEKMIFDDGEVIEGQEAEFGEDNDFIDPLEELSGEGECDE